MLNAIVKKLNSQHRLTRPRSPTDDGRATNGQPTVRNVIEPLNHRANLLNPGEYNGFWGWRWIRFGHCFDIRTVSLIADVGSQGC